MTAGPRRRRGPILIAREEWNGEMTERMIEVNGVELCTPPA